MCVGSGLVVGAKVGSGKRIMGNQTKIAWCDMTFNPWIGCEKVSPGCAHCYAEAMNSRFKGGNWGKGAPRRRTSEANWRLPLRWNDKASRRGERLKVFCASMADWLDDAVPIDWLADLLDLIRQTPFLDWLLLTKRPENWRKQMQEALAEIAECDWPDDEESELYRWLYQWVGVKDSVLGFVSKPPENVWIGVTMEDQLRADLRLPALLDIPAVVRFVSAEPLLGPLDLSVCYDGFIERIHPGIDWVICGGESGPGCRPMKTAWASSLRRDCRNAGVPFFMKQLGGHPDKGEKLTCLPVSLQVREFPSRKGSGVASL